VDPPPDLVIEVEVASGSLDKFPIYALYHARGEAQ
jgi:Uma2 family endonuclease